MQTALDAVAPGGRIVLVGLGAEKCCVPTMQTVFKEIDFLGSFRYTNTVSFLCCVNVLAALCSYFVWPLLLLLFVKVFRFKSQGWGDREFVLNHAWRSNLSSFFVFSEFSVHIRQALFRTAACIQAVLESADMTRRPRLFVYASYF